MVWLRSLQSQLVHPVAFEYGGNPHQHRFPELFMLQVKRRLTLLEELLPHKADKEDFETENIKQGKKIYNFLHLFS